MFDIEHVCTDYYPAYRRIVPENMHIETKAETAAIEGLNSRIRHYLARFHRKPSAIPKLCTWCKPRYACSLQMIGYNIYFNIAMPKIKRT